MLLVSSIAFTVFAIANYIYYTRNNVDIENQYKVKELYVGNKNNKYSASFTSVFLIRRFLFVTLLIVGQGLNTRKILIMFIIQLIHLIQLIVIRPLKYSRDMLIELVNDTFFTVFVGSLFYLYNEEAWTNILEDTYLYLLVANNLIVVCIIMSK